MPKSVEELTFDDLMGDIKRDEPGTMGCKAYQCAFFEMNTEPSDYDPEEPEEGEEPPALGGCTSPDVAAMDTEKEPGGRPCPFFKQVDPATYEKRLAALDAMCED